MYRFWFILVATCLSASMSMHGASADEHFMNDAIVLSSYHVSANVNSRLMTTSIDMVFENPNNCSSVYGMTIQLPRNARVTDLVMDLSDGCQLGSQVKTLDDAVTDFQDFSSAGKAAAILTAWDMSNYELEVSVPPNGVTSASLRYQDLLYQKLDKVSFQVPMFPGIAVDDLTVDVSVEDEGAGVIKFETDDKSEITENNIELILDGKKGTMHYEGRGLTEDTPLPTLFNAYFQPGPSPDTGLFLSDGKCFTHIFNPTTFLSDAGSMARKIAFVIDVSGSMTGQKLSDAKASFVVMIDSLEEQDTVIIQSFSSQGTESQWGPKAATTANKAEAKEFVFQLETRGSTNLNGAFLDGIENVYDAPESVAPILVMLTDGQGNSGAKDIARNVRNRNEGGEVKIFSLAFGYDADIDLLLAIAIQNGGRAVRIYEGFGDTSHQMEKFYKEELGSILMSDVIVSYDFGDVDILDSTASKFPVFAAGSEIVVRGEMNSLTDVNASSRSLKSLVTATSAVGAMEWPVDHLVIPVSDTNDDCSQSFAQARIVELLEYRDAERSIGDELLIGSTTGRSTNVEVLSFEEKAQKIALDAGLVWPGLTALVTVENANCQQDKSNVCYSGTDRESDNDDFGQEEFARDSDSGKLYSGPGFAQSAPSLGAYDNSGSGMKASFSPPPSGYVMTSGGASVHMFVLASAMALLGVALWA